MDWKEILKDFRVMVIVTILVGVLIISGLINHLIGIW